MALVVVFVLFLVSFLFINTYKKAKVLDAKYAITNSDNKELNLKIQRVYKLD